MRLSAPRTGGAQLSTSAVSHGCADVLVLGAGVAGLATAITLARSGVPVEVLEKDYSPAPAGRRGAGTWRRDGVPQANQAHVFAAGCHQLLAEHLPDVLDRLLAAGARELPADGAALAVRRPVFDWVLRRVAEREPLLRVHGGVAATGLDWTGGRLSSVRVSGGTVRASVAVDATGAAGPAGTWRTAPGQSSSSQSSSSQQGSGERVAHFSRDYALHWPGDPSELNQGTAAGGAFRGYLCRAVPGDNNTFTITFTVPSGPLTGVDNGSVGAEWLAGLATADGFEAAASRVPLVSRWLDPGVAEPLSEVNVLRVPVSDGRRVVSGSGLPGLVAVGDALRTDDPCAGLGVASALASGFACAALVPDMLARRDPNLGLITEAMTEGRGRGAVASQVLDGPSLAELLGRVPRRSVVSV